MREALGRKSEIRASHAGGATEAELVECRLYQHRLLAKREVATSHLCASAAVNVTPAASAGVDAAAADD
jgi:hypothetical protein